MKEIKLGLVGCGTVGTGVVKILDGHRHDIQARLGVPLGVKRIAVQQLQRERDAAVDRDWLTTDVASVINDDEIDIIIELIGGVEPARSIILDALKAGKRVVTANKALLAAHGTELFETANENRSDILFEASVCGGIPIIRALRESLASDHIRSLYGIINGTSNFILSKMSHDGTPYGDVLREAQRLGFAEADPTLDVNGMDAAQKLAILINLAFGVHVDAGAIFRVGVDAIDPLDVEYAKEFGFTVKPLSIARLRDAVLEARVQPVLVPSDSILASVGGAFNAVRVDADALGPMLLYGQGAGMMPTAVSVVSDVIEMSRNVLMGTYGRIPHLAFLEHKSKKTLLGAPDGWTAPFYLRFSVVDQPGVLATITGVLGEKKISIQQMVQKNPKGGRAVQVVIFTHAARYRDVRLSLEFLDTLDITVDATQSIPVEEAV